MSEIRNTITNLLQTARTPEAKKALQNVLDALNGTNVLYGTPTRTSFAEAAKASDVAPKSYIANPCAEIPVPPMIDWNSRPDWARVTLAAENEKLKRQLRDAETDLVNRRRLNEDYIRTITTVRSNNAQLERQNENLQKEAVNLREVATKSVQGVDTMAKKVALQQASLETAYNRVAATLRKAAMYVPATLDAALGSLDSFAGSYIVAGNTIGELRRQLARVNDENKRQARSELKRELECLRNDLKVKADRSRGAKSQWEARSSNWDSSNTRTLSYNAEQVIRHAENAAAFESCVGAVDLRIERLA